MNNIDKLTIEDMRLIASIVEEGSLTEGANRLNIGQSNASYCLKKLQIAFGAPLFRRSGRKLAPTEYGQHAYTHIKRLLANFETAVVPPVFDPKEDFSLSFGATEHEIFSVFPKLIEKIRNHAPKLKLRILALDTIDVERQAKNLDFIFLPLKPISDNFKSLKLFDDGYVTIYDPNVRKAPLSVSDFASAPHAVASYDGAIITNIDHLLAEQNLQRSVRLSVFGFVGLAQLMRNTDYITTLPKGIAHGSFPGFATCKCPLPIKPMPLFLCWDVAKSEHGKCKWVVNIMSELYCQLDTHNNQP